MNPIIVPPAMGKIVGQTRFFSLGEATSLGEGRQFKPVKLSLKIDLVSYPARAKGLVNMYNNRMKQGTIPQRFTRSIVKLLRKDKHGRDGISNFRPLTKILGDRL